MAASTMWLGVLKSGWPMPRVTMDLPWRSSSAARASTSKAVSVPKRARLSTSCSMAFPPAAAGLHMRAAYGACVISVAPPIADLGVSARPARSPRALLPLRFHDAIPQPLQKRRDLMRVTCLAAIAAIAALLATPVLAQQSPGPRSQPAQLPPPFGAPGPIVPGLPHCSPQHQRLLKLQMEGMKQLQRLSRSQGETLCATLEGADVQGVDKLIDPKALQRFLTPDQREL